MYDDITAVILTGGKSSRIGKNKAFLKIDNKPLIEILIHKLKKLFNQIIISTKTPQEYKYLESGDINPASTCRGWVKIVKDRFRVFSSLVGIYSALRASETGYIFVSAVDMPAIDRLLIKRLLRNHKNYDVVIPQTSKGLEPLCAIYSKKCLKYIANQIRNNNYKIIDFFNKAEVKIIRLNRKGIFNINTLKDYRVVVRRH